MTLVQRLPTGRPGQALAVALTLAVLLLAWEVLVSPLLGFYEGRADDLAAAQSRVSHAEALVVNLPALRAEARRVKGSGPASSSLLDGATDAVAAAALQGKVQDLAAATGTNLSSTEALTAKQQGRYRRISLRVSLSATLPILVHMIQSIEGGSPRMLVDDLQLHTSPILMAASRDISPALDASMTVIAFRSGQGDTDDSGAGGAGDGSGAGGAGNSGDNP